MDILNDSVHHFDSVYENSVLTYDAKVESVQENFRENALLMLAEWVDGLDSEDPALAALNQGIIDMMFGDHYNLRLRLIASLTDSQWAFGRM